MLVTGRRLPAARRAAEALGEVDLVLHNGALVVEDGVILRCLPLERELARRAIRIGRRLHADPVVHAGQRGEGRLLLEGVEPSNTLLAYYVERSNPDVVQVADLEAALDEDPLQVMFGGRQELMEELLPQLQQGMGAPVRIERTVYPRQGVGILDVLAPGVNKAEAVAFLQRRWSVPASETLAIGDNWNDAEMLAEAGLGLVMGNADPELQRPRLPGAPHERRRRRRRGDRALRAFVGSAGSTQPSAVSLCRRVRPLSGASDSLASGADGGEAKGRGGVRSAAVDLPARSAPPHETARG